MTIEQFKKDVYEGLSNSSKFLSSKYFYDKEGDELFKQIMNLEEYYLTDSEHEILLKQARDIIISWQVRKEKHFDLIDIGSGDGKKTREIIKILYNEGYLFSYMPIDISENILNCLEDSLKEEFPNLEVYPKREDYFEVLLSLKERKDLKVVLFLGSNLGNLSDKKANHFLTELGNNLHSKDKIFLGLDLMKSENIILPAYNDKLGVTKKFNLNLLARMNRELEADFRVEAFDHCPEYNEYTGVAISFLESQKKQTIYIKSIDKKFYFEKGEKIKTEISRKYNDGILEKILLGTNFFIIDKKVDSKEYFADYTLEHRV